MTATTTRPAHREPTDGHVRDTDFRHRAACRSVDPELFFPTATHGPEFEAQASTAKSVCDRCPVREACLTWALSELPDGIAGAMTADERRTERGRRARAHRFATSRKW